MPHYDDQQSRLASSFTCYRSLCMQDCDCGRTHFVSADGHGDYDEGQLEELQEKALAEPDKYVEEGEYDHVDAVVIDGREIVPDCPCGSYKRYCDFIEGHAEELAAYLTRYFDHKKSEGQRGAETAGKLATAMASAAPAAGQEET